MTKEQLAELRKLAEAATPGPWYAGSDWVTADLTFTNTLLQLNGSNSYADGFDLNYIATANPQTILHLLDYIETLEKDAGRYRFLRKFLTPKDMPILIGREERDASNESNEIDFIVDATELEVEDWK